MQDEEKKTILQQSKSSGRSSMKTIEERAKEYVPDAFDPDYILPAREGYIVNKKRLAYIAGAKEQKAIDIDKACEWLKERVQCGVHPQRAYGFAEEFRKAMEE